MRRPGCSLAVLLCRAAGRARSQAAPLAPHEGCSTTCATRGRWQAAASDQVQRRAARATATAACAWTYDFAGVSGYAVMRRALPVAWPAHFDLVARLKGAAPCNDFQFKLVDASGDNVWWVNRPGPRAAADARPT